MYCYIRIEVNYLSDDKFMKSNLLEIIGTIVFMIMYYLLGIHYFPVILLFFPTAFIVIGVRRGIVQSLISLIVVSIGIVITIDALIGIISFLLFLPITMIIIYGIKSRKKPMEILSYSTVVFFISTLLLFGYTQNLSGISIISQMEESFKQVLSFYVELLGNMEFTSFEIQKTKDYLESGYKYMIWTLPAILIIFSLFISYCNYYTSVLASRKMGIGVVNLPRFSKFKLPSNIISGTIVMILGVLLIKEMNLASFETIFLNVAVLISIMFLIQGLSVIDFYLIKLRLNLFFRIIFIMIMAILAPLGTLISLVGITDVIFDYRKFRKVKS
jgi:uncharacterized protein YybS (DUF2232 family)